MGRKCFVPNCKTGYKSCHNKLSLFKSPKDEVMLTKWRRAIPRSDRELSESDHVCELHFEPHLMIREWIAEHNGNIVQKVTYKIPKLDRNAIPTLFPGCPSYLSKSTKPARKSPPRRTALIERKRVKKINLEMENRANKCDMETEEPEDSNNGGECSVNTCSSANVDKNLTYAKVKHALAFQQLKLPTIAWGTHELKHFGLNTICITELIETCDNRLINLKKICVDESMNFKVYLHDTSVELAVFDVNTEPKTLEELQLLISKVHQKVLCTGGPNGVKYEGFNPEAAYVDMSGVWRHRRCKLFVETNTLKHCRFCIRLDDVLNLHAKRKRQQKDGRRVRIRCPPTKKLGTSTRIGSSGEKL